MARKVLLAAMSLGIGGAETHIIELALEMKRRGLNVHVASNGGVYVSDLESAGIPHYVVPMDRRSVSSMLKSLRLMYKLIKKEKPDIVHAHARIPGFICGLLSKVMRFGFVTTAHGAFDVGHGLRYLTNWGDKTIVVSEDIMKYLTENYGIDPKNIIVSQNGINTECFSPRSPSDEIYRELELDKNYPVICHVSRLDKNSSFVARQLIEMMPKLCNEIPGITLLIVGGGNAFDELYELAVSINTATGTNTVVMPGASTNISSLLTVCDLFVGVSRASMEAMSMKKPVILAGNPDYNQGMSGLFTPEKLKNAIETNFTCRGCTQTTREALQNEVLHFFKNVTETERKELGEFGRALVVSDYSVSKMTDDCLLAYGMVSRRKQNILLSGYYGFKNAGDEAILQSIYKGILSFGDEVTITVLSYDPEDSKTRYGCDAINRFKVFSVLRALLRCDVLVSGGGSLLQDYTSTRSLMYYLFLIRAAKLLGKRVMIYANGIGPVKKKINRRRVRRVVNKADIITLRDSASLNELRAMGINRADMKVTADPVFTLRGKTRDEAIILLGKHNVPDKPYAVVSIRDWPDMNGFCESVAAICDAIYEEHGRNIVFISMQSDRDITVSKRVQGMMKNPSYVLENRFMADELMGIIGASDIVLAMRLHALIFAARMCVPFAGLVYDPKVEALMEMLSMPSAGSVTNLKSDEALEAVKILFDRHREYTNAMEKKTAELELAAKSDTVFLRSLLRRRK